MVTSEMVRVVLIGVGATLLMDMWSLIQQRLGVATLNYALVGRWAGHVCRGRFVHSSIGKAQPIAGERALGWGIHYAVGIVFAALLVGIAGAAWMANPRWLPALTVGIATVVVPWCIMQPAMGAGFASSRTPTPWVNRLRSLATHAVFGLGLYVAATALNTIVQ